MEFAAELQASLQEFVASGAVEVRENGGRVAPFSGMSWEVRGAGEKPLLHLWSEQFHLTRRVLAITDHSDQRLALAVERFGRTKPDRLEFIRKDFERSARELSREEFRDRLARLLAEQFPSETLESLTVSPDLEHSLSGNYARGLLRHGSDRIALLAVPDGETSDTADNSLTFALLWLARARLANHRGTIQTLRILLPQNASRTVTHRLAALDDQCVVEVYERNPVLETLEKIDPRRVANLDTWLVCIGNRKLSWIGRALRLKRSSRCLRRPSRCIRLRNPTRSGCGFAGCRLPVGTTGAFFSEFPTLAKSLLLPAVQH